MCLRKGSSIKTSDNASERIIETLDTKLNLDFTGYQQETLSGRVKTRVARIREWIGASWRCDFHTAKSVAFLHSRERDVDSRFKIHADRNAYRAVSKEQRWSLFERDRSHEKLRIEVSERIRLPTTPRYYKWRKSCPLLLFEASTNLLFTGVLAYLVSARASRLLDKRTQSEPTWTFMKTRYQSAHRGCSTASNKHDEIYGFVISLGTMWRGPPVGFTSGSLRRVNARMCILNRVLYAKIQLLWELIYRSLFFV